MRIDHLADYPHYISTLAPWLNDYWRPILETETLAERESKLRAHCRRDRLPMAWVAHDGGQVYGIAALREHDLPDYPDLAPWLGGVFVAPDYRGRGIATALCAEVERQARQRFGVETLYLFTLDRQAWYQHLGWGVVQPCSWLNRPGLILSKAL